MIREEENFESGQSPEEALFNTLVEHFQTNQTIRAKKESGNEIGNQDLLRKVTEDEAAWTKFIYQVKDKDAARHFWEEAADRLKGTGFESELEGFKRGVVCQVAVLKCLDKLEQKSRLATPDEDMFNATDLWLKKESIAIQVKGRKKLPGLAFISQEEVSFPAIEHEGNEAIHYIMVRDTEHETERFFAKIERLAEIKHRPVKGFMIYIPEEMLENKDTGEPSEELFWAFKDEFYKHHLDS